MNFFTRTHQIAASHRWFLATLLVVGVLGCSEPADEGPKLFDPKSLVPGSGVVSLNGKPLTQAVVTFLPETGVPAVGETDSEGRYELRTIRSQGVEPGDYKVGISYLVSSDGEPQGLAARNAAMPTPAMISAREQLPPEYSDLFRTKQRAKVTLRGGAAFNFDVMAVIPMAERDAEPKPKASGNDVETAKKKAGKNP